MYMAVSNEESLPSTIGASLWPVLLLFKGGTVAMMIAGGEMEQNMRQPLAMMVARGGHKVHMRQLVEPALPCPILFRPLESPEEVLSISKKR